MKKSITMLVLAIIVAGGISAQSTEKIADVSQRGNYLQILGEGNKKISEFALNPSMEFLGFGQDFFVVKVGNYFTTYDAKSKKIADMGIRPGMVFRSAAGNSFTIKNGSYVQTYDKNCKKLSERSGS